MLVIVCCCFATLVASKEVGRGHSSYVQQLAQQAQKTNADSPVVNTPSGTLEGIYGLYNVKFDFNFFDFSSFSRALT